jgi:hypothetical protein
MRVPAEVDVPTNINITLPANIPLMCDAVQACELFSVGKTTLDILRLTYPDFPAKKIGRSVLYLVPDMYAWFRDFPDRIIPTK